MFGFLRGKRTRDDEEEPEGRAPKRARNAALPQDFHDETDQYLQLLEDTSSGNKQYRLSTAQRQLLRDSEIRRNDWREALQLTREHIRTPEEAHAIIRRITKGMDTVLAQTYIENRIRKQLMAVIRQREDPSASVVEIAHRMITNFEPVMTSDCPVCRLTYDNLQTIGRGILALMPGPLPGRPLQNPGPDRSASQQALEHLERRKRDIGPDEILSDDDICAICQQAPKTGDTVIEMRCGHILHENCVHEWLENYNHACPICRTSISDPDSESLGQMLSLEVQPTHSTEGQAKQPGKTAALQPFDDIVEPPRQSENIWRRCSACRLFLCLGSCGGGST